MVDGNSHDDVMSQSIHDEGIESVHELIPVHPIAEQSEMFEWRPLLSRCIPPQNMTDDRHEIREQEDMPWEWREVTHTTYRYVTSRTRPALVGPTEEQEDLGSGISVSGSRASNCSLLMSTKKDL
jgi:hypothetical protein